MKRILCAVVVLALAGCDEGTPTDGVAGFFFGDCSIGTISGNNNNVQVNCDPGNTGGGVGGVTVSAVASNCVAADQCSAVTATWVPPTELYTVCLAATEGKLCTATPQASGLPFDAEQNAGARSNILVTIERGDTVIATAPERPNTQT